MSSDSVAADFHECADRRELLAHPAPVERYARSLFAGSRCLGQSLIACAAWARRHTVVLLLLALLVVSHQVLLQPSLTRLGAEGLTINLAGRQRMLSQKLAKSALELLVAPDLQPRQSIQRELHETLTLLQSTHQLLESAAPSTNAWGENSAIVQRAFRDLNRDFLPMQDAADRLDRFLAANGLTFQPSDVRPEVEQIVQASGPFLAKMDAIVSQYTEEARNHAGQLRYFGWALLAGVLLAAGAVSARRAATQRRIGQLAAQLAHAGRVNALGEMAASLAHEVNQPLGAIANFAGGCLSRLEREPYANRELREPMQRIIESATRAGAIVRRMTGFVKQQHTQTSRGSLSETVGDVFALCQPEADRLRVRFQLDLPVELPQVMLDPIALQQVLVNLILNAFHAAAELPLGSGCVTVTCQGRPHNVIEFSVLDNGPGVKPADVAKLFAPFFTTREEGTGLGLAISRRLIEGRGGHIWYQSASGGGADFRFTLLAAANGRI